jgi:quinol monooxygenase YgiN
VSRCLLVLVAVLLVPSSLGSQTRGEAPAPPKPGEGGAPDNTFYAVSYVEAAASSTARAASALKQYRDANRSLDGFVRIDILEQLGRPGHFVLIETWRDQKAFDARDAAVQKRLFDALEAIRVSGYDQRPYKTLTVAADKGSAPQAVYVVSHVDFAPNVQTPVPTTTLLRQLADASRKETANLRFDIVQHTMRGNHFTVIEGWRNQQALDAHVAAPHTKQYRDAVQPATGSPLDERAYRVVD